MIRRCVPLWVFACLAATSPAAWPSGDWPEFRGPTGQGVAEVALPVEWSASRNIAWRQPIPGQGWSSPVLKDARVYLTTAVEPEGGSAKLSLRALCLDSVTGRVLWNVEVFAPDLSAAAAHHKKNGNASPTPLLANDRLYVHFGHHGTACLNLKGEVQWRSTEVHYRPVHGNAGSPVLAGSSLIFSCDGAEQPFVAALQRDTGKLLWKTPRETSAKKKFSFSTPLLIPVNGATQVVSAGSGAVCAYDPASGREIWRVRYAEGYSVVPRPVFGQGLLFVSSGFDRPVALAIRPDGQGDVTDTHVVWTLSKGVPTTPSMLLVGEELYMVSDAGIASCVEARTGKVHWQERLGGEYSASPIFAAGRIYFLNEAGATVVVKAGTTFEKLSTNELGERALASSAAADGALFIRTEHHLFKVKG